MKWTLCLCVVAAIGCEDSSTQRAADTTVDATVDAKRPSPDAAVGDAAVGDVGLRPDSAPADVGVALDGPGPDASRPPIDLGPDATPDAARDATVDAQSPEPDACVGIQYPVLDEVREGELCNYEDDDGDGKIDEGFAYGLIGSVNILTPSNLTAYGSSIARVNEEHFVIGWVGVNRPSPPTSGCTLAHVDGRGCRIAETTVVDCPFYLVEQGAIAYNNGLVAYGYRGRANEGGAFRHYVWVMDLNGNPVGPRLRMDENDTSARDYLGIRPLGDGFHVLSQTGDGVREATIGPDGTFSTRPHKPFEWARGEGPFEVVGLDFDPDGIGFAYMTSAHWVYFVRWGFDGELLSAPVRLGAAFQAPISTGERSAGIVWMEGRYQVGMNDYYAGSTIAFVVPGPPVEFVVPEALLSDRVPIVYPWVRGLAGNSLVGSLFCRGCRMTPTGELIPPVNQSLSVLIKNSENDGRGYLVTSGRVEVSGQAFVEVAAFGCRMEEE